MIDRRKCCRLESWPPGSIHCGREVESKLWGVPRLVLGDTWIVQN